MTLAEALDIVVARTKHERYRMLCDPESPAYRPGYAAIVMRKAGTPEPELPPLRAMARNAAGAAVRFVASGFKRADAATTAARLAVCVECPRYKPSTGKCGACGCYVKIKASLMEKCPEDRWPA